MKGWLNSTRYHGHPVAVIICDDIGQYVIVAFRPSDRKVVALAQIPVDQSPVMTLLQYQTLYDARDKSFWEQLEANEIVLGTYMDIADN